MFLDRRSCLPDAGTQERIFNACAETHAAYHEKHGDLATHSHAIKIEQSTRTRHDRKAVGSSDPSDVQTLPLPPDKLVILLRLAFAFDRDGGNRIVGGIRRKIEETHAQPVLLELHILAGGQQAADLTRAIKPAITAVEPGQK